jgi:hypothetical protein
MERAARQGVEQESDEIRGSPVAVSFLLVLLLLGLPRSFHAHHGELGAGHGRALARLADAAGARGGAFLLQHRAGRVFASTHVD